jgi:hypothetical protein
MASTSTKRNKKNGRYRPGINRPMPIKDDNQRPTLVVHLLENDPPVDRPPVPADDSQPELMPDRIIQALAGVSVGLIVVALSILLGDWLS